MVRFYILPKVYRSFQFDVGRYWCLKVHSQTLFHDRSVVNLSRTEKVVKETEKDCAHSSNHAEVHRLNIYHPGSRPKGKEDSNGHINQSPGIDDDTPNPRQVKRSPNQPCTGSVDNNRVTAPLLGIRDLCHRLSSRSHQHRLTRGIQ